MPPRRTPQTPDQKATNPVEVLPPISEEAQEAFNSGIKKTVTPRGGEQVELIIRQFYLDQALEIADQLEKVYNLIKDLADEKGNVDLTQVFRTATEDVLAILAVAIERDRKFIGRLEIDDLLDIFGNVFNINKDFFVLRVKGKLTNVLGQVSTML
jgi:hypothetical protein